MIPVARFELLITFLAGHSDSRRPRTTPQCENDSYKGEKLFTIHNEVPLCFVLRQQGEGGILSPIVYRIHYFP